MKKADLLALLETVPDDAEIRLDQPTGDYWRSHLAVDITGVDEVKVEPSAYHNDQDKIMSDEDNEWDPELQTVWVLR